MALKSQASVAVACTSFREVPRIIMHHNDIIFCRAIQKHKPRTDKSRVPALLEALSLLIPMRQGVFLVPKPARLD